MNFVVFRISALFLVVQVESNLSIGIFALPIWESARFDLDEAAGLMLAPPGDAFPPLLFCAARCSPTQGHSSPPSPPSLSLSVRNSWLTDLCYHSHCVFVYVSFISLSLSSICSISFFLSLSLAPFHLSLSLSLFLYHRLCKVQLWVGESDLQTRWQEDAFSEYALLGSLCVTLFLLSLSYNVIWLVLILPSLLIGWSSQTLCYKS